MTELINQGIEDGGHLFLDGRNPTVSGYEKGNFIGATIVSLDLKNKLTQYHAKTEIKNGNENESEVLGSLSITSPLNVTNRAYTEEIFGPVLFCVHVNTLEDAIAFTNNSKYGNGCAIFTQRYNKIVKKGKIIINRKEVEF